MVNYQNILKEFCKCHFHHILCCHKMWSRSGAVIIRVVLKMSSARDGFHFNKATSGNTDLKKAVFSKKRTIVHAVLQWW